jgi:DNA-binding LacI/PurR family transcriptional regulator
MIITSQHSHSDVTADAHRAIDDEPLAAIWVPSLTTYRLDFDWAGGAALELLLDPVGGASTAGAPVSGLTVRESTQPPRA